MTSIDYFIGQHPKIGFFKITLPFDSLLNLKEGFNVYNFIGTLRGELSSGFFKRVIKDGKTALIEGQVEIDINSSAGTIKLKILKQVFKIKHLSFKQKYKQPTKKLLKVLKDSFIAGYSVNYSYTSFNKKNRNKS